MTLSRLIVLGLLLRQECATHLLEWLGWSSTPHFISTGTPLLDIPFEELGPEDKFLVEASKITGLKLSQLDVCQHKIVMKIKTSCGTLSDEDIAKLSVNLLNCQADVEGRKTFPCTEDMSLKACTSEMDAETWNAYHIVTNRARAVCYAARQEEFRALAEMTINRLVSSARTHIEQMTLMQDKQVKLEKVTQLALDRISRGQRDVLGSYSQLRRLESKLGSKLEEDTDGLKAIETFISKEADDLENIFKELKENLDEARKKIIIHKKDESAEHQKLLIGLRGSLDLIEKLITRLEEMSNLLDSHNVRYLSQSEGVANDLRAVSKTLNEISSSAVALQQLAEQKMALIFNLIGETGERFDSMVFMSSHLLCLIMAMVISTFLEFPRRLRALVVIAGILNTYSSVNNMTHSLHILDLYLFLAGAVVVDTAIVQILRVLNEKKTLVKQNLGSPKDNSYNLHKRDLNNGLKQPLSKVDEWLTEKFSDRDNCLIRNGVLPTITPFSKDDQVSVASGRSLRTRTRNISPPSSVGGSSTSGHKIICSAVRPNGHRCRLPAKSGQQLCRIHEQNR